MSIFRKHLTNIIQIIDVAVAEHQGIREVIPKIKEIVDDHYKILESKSKFLMKTRFPEFDTYKEMIGQLVMICRNIDLNTGRIRGLSKPWWEEIKDRVVIAEKAIIELEKDTKNLEHLEKLLE